MNQPVPQAQSFEDLMTDIRRGLVKIPQFQRDFVWPKEKSAQLLDSILKGFPIGTFILWKTQEQLRTVRNLGGQELPDTPPGDYAHQVLDGQQRLTSLYAAVNGLVVKRQDRTDDFGQLYVDLVAEEDEQLVVTELGERTVGVDAIRVRDLLQADLVSLAAFPSQHHARLSAYQQRFRTYQFSTVLVKDAPIEVATEIFTRINVTGKPLSTFQIMVAKTFDHDTGFDLAKRVDELQAVLRDVDYETIPPAAVLQSVSVVLVGECAKKHILRLEKQSFIGAWPQVVEAMKQAVDYFRNFFRVPVSSLLPYAALTVPFTYFFFRHRDRPSAQAARWLEDFFWRTALSGRYSHGLESKLAQDIKRMDAILANQAPDYDFGVDVSAEFVSNNGWFTASRSFIKALLCVLAYHEPKSFADGSVVRINNAWLKQANSRNYHHFFPRSFLKKREIGWKENHIANITIVDDFLNKRTIRARAPSDYMSEFRRRNPELTSTMATHLIDVSSDAVWTDDYWPFFNARCQAFSAELQRRIIPRDIDRLGQPVTSDDFDDLAESEEEV